ncbi:cell envelope biogenesis protein TolA [Bradyrhizobium diversitatis]|uniref:Cell envelope biogenesis protein TolA n=1 Tax=Bradyrhizobium diversitatis TaxID=2755406 RepID=A0ABS0P8G1_9BRAD|nr:cell envelope biogenesis protein TolA [Bradyrhizobium diversitatis]MBH5389592.1 cell envelope biogenesis protein TolA [Bradyrhizobium diversitatis]
MPKQAKSKSTRKLKTYQTSLGFYDQAIAAPSMKAALQAWGASSNLFHQGAAKETDDPDIVAATMAKPGVVLRRPVGSDGPFTESAELPTDLGEGKSERKPKRSPKSKSRKRTARTARKPSRKIDDQAARKAAAAFEKEERRREAERRKEEAARARERARREKAVATAQAAFDKARREHEARAEEIEAERTVLDERAEAEQDRWDKQRMKLEQALRRARE